MQQLLLNPQNVGNYFQLLNHEEMLLALIIDSITIVQPSETQFSVLNAEWQGEILVFNFRQEVVYIGLAH